MCAAVESEESNEAWDDQSDDTQPMSSVETAMLLRELESGAPEPVLRLPSVVNKADTTDNPGWTDFDTQWANPQFVRFPCSSLNTYRLRSDPTNYLSKWKLICDSLSASITNTTELEEVILSYSPTFIGQWTFGSLHEFGAELGPDNKFWKVTLPFIAQQAQRLDKVFFGPIPLLRSQVAAQVTLSQEQCAVLIANMFFCTFPQRSCNSAHGGSGTGAYANYPNVNFNTLYATNENAKRPNRRVQKLQCIVHYFESLAENGIPDGKISFRRNTLLDEKPDPLGAESPTKSSEVSPSKQSSKLEHEEKRTGVKPPIWTLSTSPLINPDLRVDGNIEDDGNECWHVDFANMVIGGGVIGAGCVQEEIRFVINPECLVSRLLCERLASNESVLILGAQRFSTYTGYRDTFAWSGHFEDKTPRDAQGHIRTYITAIDAVSFPMGRAYRQFSRHYIYRELNKAYIGFLPTLDDDTSFSSKPASSSSASPSKSNSNGHASWPIATGHWGCGAFNGDKHLKAVLQWLAASEAGRPLRYFAFGDEKFNSHFKSLVKKATSAELRVGDLLQHTLSFKPGPKRNLFSWLSHCIDKAKGKSFFKF